MKMSIFATLAKAKLDVESIKGSSLVAVSHTIEQLSRLGYILEQYMNIKHNVLYKTFTA
jgi:hypothetical protein